MMCVPKLRVMFFWIFYSEVFAIVSGSEVNLAHGRPTRQSSDHGSYTSDLAVDGNTQTNFKQNTCSHTQEEQGAWWAVDLGHLHNISAVAITNRGECCANQLVNFSILLSESDDLNNTPNDTYTLCAYHDGGLTLGETKVIECNGSSHNHARIVMIQLTEKNQLTLCEVQVFADVMDSANPETSVGYPVRLRSLPNLLITDEIQPSMISFEPPSMTHSSRFLSISPPPIVTSWTSLLLPSGVWSVINTVSMLEAVGVGVEQCVCRCDEDADVAQKRVKEYVEQVKTNLSVARNTTTRYLRRLISIHDDRPSAQSVGLAGVSLFCITIGLMVVWDCVGIVQKCVKLKKRLGR